MTYKHLITFAALVVLLSLPVMLSGASKQDIADCQAKTGYSAKKCKLILDM